MANWPTMICPQCGEVEHDPIPEDEAHCDCWGPTHTILLNSWNCSCPCHAPAWTLEDGTPPDFTEAEIRDMEAGRVAD